MSCQVYRDQSGNIQRVTAPNGKDSLLYDSLVNKIDDAEAALQVWAKAYTPSFKASFGDWELLSQAKQYANGIKGLYKTVFLSDPEQALFEAAVQYNTRGSDAKEAIEGFGYDLMAIAHQLFPNAKVGDKFSSRFTGKLDENGEPLPQYLTPTEYRQLVGSEARPASAATLSKVKEFLDRIGVSVKEMQNIDVDGTNLAANGVARILNGLIEIVKGKEDIALPEEAMHFAVELIEQKHPELFREMLNKIGSYEIYQTTLQDYKDVYKNAEGRPDIPKIKKEAMAKLLSQIIINKGEGYIGSSERASLVQQWWTRFIEFFKGLFSKANFDPFEKTVEKILRGEDELGSVTQLEGDTYYQINPSLIDRLKEENSKVGKDASGNWTRGGSKAKSVESLVEDFYDEKRRMRALNEDETQKARREYKESITGKAHTDIENLLGYYIDTNGKYRPSGDITRVLSPNIRKDFFSRLQKQVQDRLSSYPGGTTFLHSTNVYSEKTNTAGKVDLLALLPDGKVDVVQFRFPDTANKQGAVRTYEQTAYNIELEGVKKILESGYSIGKKDFRQLRVIPIQTGYSINYNAQGRPIYLSNLRVGDVDVDKINNDALLPIPSQSESTGSKDLDDLLYKLRGLLEKLSNEKVSPAEANEKATRIATLLASIRKLQIQRDATSLLQGADIVVKRSEDRYKHLLQRVEEAVPSQMTIQEINQLSEDVLEAKDNLLAYRDLDIIFENIYPDPDVREKKFISDAGEVARRSARLIKNAENLEDKVRTDIFAARQNIKDELDPEKSLTWYRRMIRSLSQSSIKAGAELWSLVKNINAKYKLQFEDRMKVLDKKMEAVKKWADGNGGMKAVYNKIFSFDDKGRWKGRFISQTSSDFYKQLNAAKEKRDIKWIRENIDVEKYKEWFDNELEGRKERAKTLRLHADDEINAQMVEHSIKEFIDNYDINKATAANQANFVLNAYPKKDIWASKEYTELQKPENAPLLDLYNYWQDVLEKSYDSGLISSYEKRVFFPNVRKEFLEKVSKSPLGFVGDFIDNISIHGEDSSFGKQDPLTGEPIDTVHVAFVRDLGKTAKDTDGNYFTDYSSKSMDLFRVMALWEKELILYNLKTESESIAKLLASTESRKKALKVNKSGTLVKEDDRPILIDNTANTKYIKDMIDAIYYGKKLENEQDISFKIPYGKAVKSINNLFGKEVFEVPPQEYVTVSGIKAVQSFNRYFVTKTLGANPLTALSQLFGGTVNSYLNSGKYFDKKDLLAAQAKMISGRFYDRDGKIQAGLIDYFIPFIEDHTGEIVRKHSVNKAINFLSSEWLMYMQKSADKAVQVPILLAFAENTTIKDGKLVNIRDLVKQEEGYDSIYNLPYDQMQAKKAAIEKRIEEIKAKESLLKLATIKDDQLVLPGITHGSQEVIDFRQKILEFTKDALGNTSSEDLSLYKRSVMMQSFFMFKNWIPRMIDVRGQSLKYNPGTDSYEWGRLRMMYRGLQTNGLSLITSLLKQVGGNEKNLIEMAKKIYKEKQSYFASQNEEFNMTEADFVDTYLRGVSSQFKELALTASLLGILLFARVHAPDKDDDPRIKGVYKWSLRAIDKLTDELSFFYDPTSFTNIANGSIFPAVSVLTDAQRVLMNGIKDAYYWSTGNEKGMQSIHTTKYLLKSLPLVNQMVNYTAVFNHDFAKEMGIQITSQNGRR